MSPLNNLLGFEYLPEDPPRPYEGDAQHYVKGRQPHDIDHKFLDVIQIKWRNEQGRRQAESQEHTRRPDHPGDPQ